MKRKVSVEIPEGKVAVWKDDVLTLIDEKPTDVRERVKSYEDALKELGEEPFPFETMPLLSKDEIAYIKLKTIVRALNEGWTPELKEGEYRWYVWFWLYTNEELKNMDKNERSARRGLLFGGLAHNGTNAGFGAAASAAAPSSTAAYFGSRLCFQNESVADYCAKQFIELWFEFLFPDREITHSNWEEAL